MTEVREAARRADGLRTWFEAHVVWAFLVLILASALSIAIAFHESASQGDRATAAATKVLNAHEDEIHTIAVVAHTSLYRACVRDRTQRLAVRKNTLAGRVQARAFYSFLGVAIERAKLTQRDTKVTPEVRAGAATGIAVYGRLQDRLDIDPVIPPLPPSCLDPRVVPTVAAFETIAKKAAASRK